MTEITMPQIGMKQTPGGESRLEDLPHYRDMAAELNRVGDALQIRRGEDAPQVGTDPDAGIEPGVDYMEGDDYRRFNQIEN